MYTPQQYQRPEDGSPTLCKWAKGGNHRQAVAYYLQSVDVGCVLHHSEIGPAEAVVQRVDVSNNKATPMTRSFMVLLQFLRSFSLRQSGSRLPSITLKSMNRGMRDQCTESGDDLSRIRDLREAYSVCKPSLRKSQRQRAGGFSSRAGMDTKPLAQSDLRKNRRSATGRVHLFG